MEAVDKHRYRGQRDNPSFSSSLLDVIYRSIDERDEDSVVYRRTMKKRQSIDGCFQVDKQKNNGSIGRSGGTKFTGEVVVRRKSAAGVESCSQRSEGDSFFFNSNIGSSCSTYGVGFPSSEVETIYGFPSRPRPIRTSFIEDDNCNTREKQVQTHPSDDLQTKGKFVKTKSRAMKIYGYLKKGKQPISPGGRLATFFISLFTTGNGKKSTMSSSCTGIHDEAIIHSNRKSKSANVSTSSSTTSFSRSCLSRTPPSSTGKLTTGMKRSVRFYPGNVIVDEYCQPRGRKSLQGNRSDSPAVKFAKESFNEELKKHLTEKNRQIEQTTMNLLKNYQKKVEYVFDSIKINSKNDEDYNDDEAASYASSDLFELDHLSAIGKDLCMEELPLYETTSIDANRAIANGFLE
ncbi:protein BIG GRAIN 1-like B [Cynara cardunculus var. scolymus]|uniref:Uncharacterized protein n=1 Tax=Cynara cardunculus var. scolymus TaxID=59895 RepID=A0A103YB57_CYNCS|nr:protein BIG GRAIN 1-like B [Cynara cardunculus var. scolymus]KVI05864.1 hypothetical protein Ccrd_015794 [Cynara cardunculus var. scolymus]